MREVKLQIAENVPLRPDVFRLRLAGDCNAVTAPGQFVSLSVPGLFLRRPFSVCDREEGALTLVYQVKGKGTEALSRMRSGALDVLTVPATMKKGRPGVVLEVLCSGERRAEVAAAVFRHTSTIGVREHVCRRMTLARRTEAAAMPDGSTVRVKVSEGFGVTRRKPEHDDVAAYALSRGIPLADARPMA